MSSWLILYGAPAAFFNVWRHLNLIHIYITLHYPLRVIWVWIQVGLLNVCLLWRCDAGGDRQRQWVFIQWWYSTIVCRGQQIHPLYVNTLLTCFLTMHFIIPLSDRVHRVLEKSLKVLEFWKKKFQALESPWIWMFHILKFLLIIDIIAEHYRFLLYHYGSQMIWCQ